MLTASAWAGRAGAAVLAGWASALRMVWSGHACGIIKRKHHAYRGGTGAARLLAANAGGYQAAADYVPGAMWPALGAQAAQLAFTTRQTARAC
ncbi:hypothetical protein LAD77_00325 [Klebsiella pneumoniae]|nr:hypothetical protein [Klebsiella pneumoniae]